jgi:hypothetical protein
MCYNCNGRGAVAATVAVAKANGFILVWESLTGTGTALSQLPFRI